jgi:hypothetical protein
MEWGTREVAAPFRQMQERGGSRLVVADVDTPARVVVLMTAQRRHGRPSAACSGTRRK